jgi:tetratricopeptide (TPR) repeat protein
MVGTPQEVMFRGLQLHRMGNLEGAATLYRSILEREPGHVDTIGLLGMLELQQGRVADAIELMQRAVTIRPEFATIHMQLGLLWQSMGGFADAALAFRRVLALEPRDTAAHVNLGVALRALERRDEALAHFQEAVELSPTLAEAHTNLGELYLEMGQTGRALGHCQTAVALRPDLAEAHNNLGNVLRLLGRFAEARECCRRAIELNPRLAQAHASMGLSFQYDGWHQVLPWLRWAVTLDPKNVDYLAYVGDAAAEHELFPEAEDCCRKVLAVNPRHPIALNALGWVYQAERHTDEALACYRAAIAAKPDFAKAHFNLGGLYEQIGDFAAAEACYRAAIDHEPASEAAMSKLAIILEKRLPDKDMARMKARLDVVNSPPPLRSSLLFGMARVHDARGEYQVAAPMLSEANAISLQIRKSRDQCFDSAKQLDLVDRLNSSTDAAFFERLANSGIRTRRPVFVFGLPRSGTSLIEQILASHAEVHGGGELPFSMRGFESLPTLTGRTDEPVDCFADLTCEQVRSLAAQHDAWLTEIDGGACSRVIDKLPGNYYYLGMIALLFPDATLIHCRRDPRDVAVSCWMANFRTINWANHPDHLVAHFEVYSRLMAHWRGVLPIPIVEVDYEHTVTDLETVARRLVAACGLEWDPACLEFHRSNRPVRTASVAQVRQPVYRGSLERCRNYADDPELSGIFERVTRLSEWT